MASSSMPICSMSSGLRCAMGLSDFFCRTVMRLLRRCWGGGLEEHEVLDLPRWSVVDLAGAGGGIDAGLDLHAVAGGGGGERTVAEVADGALAQRQHAAEADPHPAARRHQHAGGL